MAPDLIKGCWKALLSIRHTLEAHTGPVNFCSVVIGKSPQVKINDDFPARGEGHIFKVFLDSEPDGGSHPEAQFTITNLIEVTPAGRNRLPLEAEQFLITYLPYCFLSGYARKWERTVAVSHFAQSLDGRIATGSGDSKWIGDEHNLTHAHRMRALCHGILIGSKTLKKDRPELTVRRVEGPDPRPVILGSIVQPGNHARKGLVFASENGFLSPWEILDALYQEKIWSVYVEGGSATTSHFLQNDAIDILQVHISPLILGSGISSFSLTPIETILEARRFRVFRYQPLGNGLMFVGVPESQGRTSRGEVGEGTL